MRTNAPAPKTAAAPVVTTNTGTRGVSIVDNRPETVQAQALTEVITNSPRMVAQRQMTEAITNSPRMVAQRQMTEAITNSPRVVAQRAVLPQPNRTGLPDKLKAGVENLSGHSLDDVRVHYNSAKPAQLQAHAYAQGAEIHLAPGQEKHLPHEAWHVVQQKQGRVRATRQMKGIGMNDDLSLEREADVMGAQAMRGAHISSPLTIQKHARQDDKQSQSSVQPSVVQRMPTSASLSEVAHQLGLTNVTKDWSPNQILQLVANYIGANPGYVLTIIGGLLALGVGVAYIANRLRAHDTSGDNKGPVAKKKKARKKRSKQKATPTPSSSSSSSPSSSSSSSPSSSSSSSPSSTPPSSPRTNLNQDSTGAGVWETVRAPQRGPGLSAAQKHQNLVDHHIKQIENGILQGFGYPKYTKKEKPEKAGSVKNGPTHQVNEKTVRQDVYNYFNGLRGQKVTYGSISGYLYIVAKTVPSTYNVTIHSTNNPSTAKTLSNMHVTG